MNKLFAVLKREYLQAVRKKAFIIMTLLMPLLMSALLLLPALLVERGLGEKKVAVVDGTGMLRKEFLNPNEIPVEEKQQADRERMSGRRTSPDLPTQIRVEYVDARGADLKAVERRQLDRLGVDEKSGQRIDGVFVIPGDAVNAGEKTRLTYYSRTAADLMTQERLSRRANKAIQRFRLTENGIASDQVEQLVREVPSEAVQLSKSGEQKKGGEAKLFICFIFVALLMVPSFVYGNEIMRGIVQEKSDRVVEVLISSMTPVQLLSGKISGIAAVGLTQISVWAVMGGVLSAFGAAVASAADIDVSQFLNPMIAVYFVLFFILAYSSYVCIYAIAGAVSNSEKEAQQFVGPLMIVMMTPWFVMFPIIMNPDSPLAVGFSLSPVFGPITMFCRLIVAEPPLWHVATSIAVSVATISFFFWITAKIFRVGILSYGKRPTIPELWRWLKVA